MKYLEAPSLSVLSSKLNQVTESDMKLDCRIELYSCMEYKSTDDRRQDVCGTEEIVTEIASRFLKRFGRYLCYSIRFCKYPFIHLFLSFIDYKGEWTTLKYAKYMDI